MNFFTILQGPQGVPGAAGLRGVKGDQVMINIERFSNDCRKTKTKAITLTNHNRNKQRDEPITIPSNHL